MAAPRLHAAPGALRGQAAAASSVHAHAGPHEPRHHTASLQRRDVLLSMTSAVAAAVATALLCPASTAAAASLQSATSAVGGSVDAGTGATILGFESVWGFAAEGGHLEVCCSG